MAQEINEVGIIRVSIEENVVFTSRTLRDIQITTDFIFVEYDNISEKGSARVSISIPADRFAESEACLWSVIDKVRKEG